MPEAFPVIPAGGEFRARLKERFDRNGDKYLFGGLRIFNMVVFVRPSKDVPGEWILLVRPFVAAGQTDDD